MVVNVPFVEHDKTPRDRGPTLIGLAMYALRALNNLLSVFFFPPKEAASEISTVTADAAAIIEVGSQPKDGPPDEHGGAGSGATPPSLSSLLRGLAAQSDEDVEDENSCVYSISPDSLANSQPYSLTIRETFNFDTAAWRERVQSWGLRGLEEELEAYGLADRGEVDGNELVADEHDLCV